jgi:nucleotide-binding universal stress UspA family protein
MKIISYMKILVPTAGPIPARESAEYIINIASKLNAELFAMHILTPEISKDEAKRSEGKEALEIFNRSAQQKDIKITPVLHEGELVPSIIDFAENNNIDLIVMGAGEDRIVAEWIISDLKEQSQVPVVVIPYGFSSIFDKNELF